jgi:flagellar biosynthesis chaperone FliJ
VSILTADLFKDIQQPERYLNDCIRKVKITRYQYRIDQLRRKLQEHEPTTSEFKQIIEQINEKLIHIQEIQKIFKAK